MLCFRCALFSNCFFLTILCHCGLAFVSLNQVSDADTISLSPGNSFYSPIESRFIPLPFGGLFQNKIRTKNEINLLQSQVTLLETEVAGLLQFQDRVTSILKNNLSSFNDTIKTLNQSIPHCPSSVNQLGLGAAKVIGTYCYYVDPTKKNFANALTRCRDLGGTLAEPMPNFSGSLYDALKNAFPIRFDIIENEPSNNNPGKLWIGVTRTEADAAPIYVTTGQEVIEPPFSAGTILTVPFSALMKVGGVEWSADTANDATANANDPSYSYVCQFTTL